MVYCRRNAYILRNIEPHVDISKNNYKELTAAETEEECEPTHVFVEATLTNRRSPITAIQICQHFADYFYRVNNVTK